MPGLDKWLCKGIYFSLFSAHKGVLILEKRLKGVQKILANLMNKEI
jgi:hypothetical protein